MNNISINSTSTKLQLTQSGSYVITYDNITEADVTIHVDKNLHVELVFLYNVKQLDDHTRILVSEHSQVKSAYCYFDEMHINQDITYELLGAYARVDVASAGVIKQHVNVAMKIVHKAKATYGDQKHYCVVYENAVYEMEACGKIEKAMEFSEAYQTTRVLTLGSSKNCKVTPVLLIDEHNVKASHANSIGQPDADQLYYMFSRGLSREAALKLISKGYMAPVVSLLENSDLYEYMQNLIEERVHFDD